MKYNALKIRMEALLNRIQTWLEDNPHHHMHLELANSLFNEYSSIVEKLENTKNELFCNLPHNYNGRMEPSGSLVLSSEVRNLRDDTQYCLDILTSALKIEIPSVEITKEGIFFAGQYFDAFQKVSEILQDAKKSIYVIDGYIDANFLSFFTTKDTALVVEIMTKVKSNKTNLVSAAEAFNKQYQNLSIRVSEAFHDRFVIIDEQNFYHFGASIKDAGGKGFMFSVIEEPIVMKTLLDEYRKEWSSASIII